ncbi:MAG TPA: ParA family partition ATPase [Candidatus Brocadiaceae bacterium]
MFKSTEPKTYVIAVLNQKGGVGKTTIATNLAHGLNLMDIPTLLVDGDPQGSARDWHEANGASLVPCVGLDRETLPEDLKSVRNGYEVIVIDGAPQIAKLSAAAIRIADLVLIPVQPSPYDVWATADLVELIKCKQTLTNGFPKAVFILSRVIKNTNLGRDVIGALNEYGFPILTGKTTQYVSYAQSASRGESVFCHPVSLPAEREFSLIINELVDNYIKI